MMSIVVGFFMVLFIAVAMASGYHSSAQLFLDPFIKVMFPLTVILVPVDIWIVLMVTRNGRNK